MSWFATWSFRLLSTAGILAGVAVGLLYVFQEKLLYVPRIPGVPDIMEDPEKWGFNAENVSLTSKDGTKLHAWLLTLQGWSSEFIKSRPVLVFFQENAGNMSHRLPFLQLLAHRLQVVIYAPSYRGYGFSEGRPAQKGIQEDAAASLDHLLSRTDVDTSKVVIFGRSLGGAVAIHLVAKIQHRIRGLIVENTFTSVEDMVSRVLPPLGAFIGQGKPLNFLVTNKWHNMQVLPKIRDVPVLLLSSKLDEMVPSSQMVQLRKACGTAQCTWMEFPNSMHMDAYHVDADLYWPTLVDFFRAYVE